MAERTIDHEVIQTWIEARGGRPIMAEQEGGAPTLGIDFGKGQVEEVPWEEFFEIFEDNRLTFLYEEDDEVGESHTAAFVDREEEDELDEIDEPLDDHDEL